MIGSLTRRIRFGGGRGEGLVSIVVSELEYIAHMAVYFFVVGSGANVYSILDKEWEGIKAKLIGYLRNEGPDESVI